MGNHTLRGVIHKLTGCASRVLLLQTGDRSSSSLYNLAGVVYCYSPFKINILSVCLNGINSN